MLADESTDYILLWAYNSCEKMVDFENVASDAYLLKAYKMYEEMEGVEEQKEICQEIRKVSVAKDV